MQETLNLVSAEIERAMRERDQRQASSRSMSRFITSMLVPLFASWLFVRSANLCAFLPGVSKSDVCLTGIAVGISAIPVILYYGLNKRLSELLTVNAIVAVVLGGLMAAV